MIQAGHDLKRAHGRGLWEKVLFGSKVWQGLSWGGAVLGCGKSGWKAYTGNGTKLLPNITRKGKAA